MTLQVESATASPEELNACMTGVWESLKTELYRFLLAQIGDRDRAEDLLQDVFLQAHAHADSFCSIENPRAWLYRTARNRLIDTYRTAKDFTELVDETLQEAHHIDALQTLSVCLPETLQALDAEERFLLEECDLRQRPQQEVAKELMISLTALKSRLLRARSRLKSKMMELCDIESNEATSVCCHRNMPS